MASDDNSSPFDLACKKIADIIHAAAPPPTAEELLADIARQCEVERLKAESSAKVPKTSNGSAADEPAGPAALRRRRRQPPVDAPKTAPAAPATDDDDNPVTPRLLGFDVERLNQEFALVLLGSKAVVFFERPKSMIEDQKRMLSLEAFDEWFANRPTEQRGADGKIRRTTWAKAWRKSPERRQYFGVEFHPDPANTPGTDGYLNLWSGFSIKPASNSDPKKYKTFRDHLLVNVCSGDQERFRWVFGFFAHMIQRPRERLGKALVLCGKMGTGKTKVGEIIGRLIPQHYFLVDDPRYVTGNFNAHMATCILLQADEAVWAGDKAAEGRLKGLITSPFQQIEAKGIDPIRLPNYVRLFMTSNETWVVPAGKDERRFAVFNVDPRCAKNNEYFREMDEELAAGGLECLLADLLAYDLNSIDLHRLPLTEALLEQKLQSLDHVDSWWYDRLWSGATTRNVTQWQQEVRCSALLADYCAYADGLGIRRKHEPIVVGMKLKKLLPDLKRDKRTLLNDEGVMKRDWCYILPPLGEAREKFEEAVEQKVDWPLDSEPAADRVDNTENVEF